MAGEAADVQLIDHATRLRVILMSEEQQLHQRAVLGEQAEIDAPATDGGPQGEAASLRNLSAHRTAPFFESFRGSFRSRRLRALPGPASPARYRCSTAGWTGPTRTAPFWRRDRKSV